MRLELRSFLIDTRSWLKFTARLDPPLVDKGKKRISKLPYRPVINAFALAFLIGIPAFNNYVAIRRPLRLNVIDRFTILSGDERRLVRSFVYYERIFIHATLLIRIIINTSDCYLVIRRVWFVRNFLCLRTRFVQSLNVRRCILWHEYLWEENTSRVSWISWKFFE